MPPFLTIGMATHDDYDGVYFTVQGLRMDHPEIADKIEILVLDNNPRSNHGKLVKHLADQVGDVRYLTFEGYASTAVRDQLFKHARGQFVLCIDCHVKLTPYNRRTGEEGSLAQLIQYLEHRPDSPHLYHGPMLYDSLRGAPVTHMAPRWSEQMYGVWATDHERLARNQPFEIPMHGMGLFCCNRNAWPGFNPAFRGFGGEEGYIHEKVRQRGAKVLCLPFLKWLHRFDRPEKVRYPLSVANKVRNYYLGWNELGLDDREVTEHFKAWLSESAMAKLRQDALSSLSLPRQGSRAATLLPHPTKL